MFGPGIYINEKDLEPKTPTAGPTPTKQTNSEDNTGTPKTTETMNPSSTTTGVKDSKDNKVPPTTVNDKATSTTINKAIASTSHIPKSDPIPNLPSSDSVDAGHGPKPEPVTRPPLIPLSFKLIWLAMMAPSHPSV